MKILLKQNAKLLIIFSMAPKTFEALKMLRMNLLAKQLELYQRGEGFFFQPQTFLFVYKLLSEQ